MERLSTAYDRLLNALFIVASLMLGAMMLIICADVLLRNVALIPGVRGVEWSNEVSESLLYLITLLAAPWLLRQGQHIRVDILLRAIPARVAWVCEAVADVRPGQDQSRTRQSVRCSACSSDRRCGSGQFGLGRQRVQGGGGHG